MVHEIVVFEDDFGEMDSLLMDWRIKVSLSMMLGEIYGTYLKTTEASSVNVVPLLPFAKMDPVVTKPFPFPRKSKFLRPLFTIINYDNTVTSNQEPVYLAHSLEQAKELEKEQIYTIMTDDDVGVGLNDSHLEQFKIEGIDIENIVDALISYEGNKEQKIGYVCTKLDGVMNVREAIVRWIFNNLLVTQ